MLEQIKGDFAFVANFIESTRLFIGFRKHILKNTNITDVREARLYLRNNLRWIIVIKKYQLIQLYSENKDRRTGNCFMILTMMIDKSLLMKFSVFGQSKFIRIYKSKSMMLCYYTFEESFRMIKLFAILPRLSYLSLSHFKFLTYQYQIINSRRRIFEFVDILPPSSCELIDCSMRCEICKFNWMFNVRKNLLC